MLFHKLISTGLGIGYIGRGAGTAAAAVTCLFWYLFQSGSINDSFLIPCLITIASAMAGVCSAIKVEAEWGKDINRVVVAGVAGMCITCLFTPFSITYIPMGFILLRFFPIAKPL